MKAEHRKELQTNSLAAGMTRLATRIKTTRPQRRTVLYLVVGITVLAVVMAYILIRRNKVAAASEMWVKLDHPYKENLELLLNPDDANTPQGKAARFQYAWYRLWPIGIKRLGSRSHDDALKLIKEVQKDYEMLAIDCEDDPILASEARYAIAVATETLAIEDISNLNEAVKQYQQVAKSFEKTAHGQLAKERLKALTFKLTDKSLASLQARRVHPDVLAKLQALKDKEFARPAFLKELATTLEPQELEKNEFVILNDAQEDPGSWNRVEEFYVTFGHNMLDPEAQFRRQFEEQIRKLQKKSG